MYTCKHMDTQTVRGDETQDSHGLESNIRHEDFRPSVRHAQGTPPIRKEKYRPATTTTTPAATATLSRSGYPPWILKRGGLESYGRIPSS